MSKKPKSKTHGIYFESDRADQRLQRGAEFVAQFPASTEVLVVGPQRSVVDDFVREYLSDRPASFGWHRFGMMQLVARLAAGVLAREGLSPATLLGQEALVARTAFHLQQESELPRLGRVSHFPGFARAVTRTLNELRLAELPAQQLGGLGGSAQDLSRLQHRYDQELENSNIADTAQLIRCAIQALEGSTADDGVARDPSPFAALLRAPILFLDVEPSSPLEQRFIELLCGGAPQFLVTAVVRDDLEEREASALASQQFWKSCGARVEVAGDSETTDESSALARLRRYLFRQEQPQQLALGEEVFFFSAPGEGRECIELARHVLKQAQQGVPFDRMAVFLRAPELYSGLLEAAFRRAGVPMYFARGTLRPDPAGRAFLALLACATENLSAKRFAEYLSFGQVPQLDAHGAPPRDRDIWRGPTDGQLGPAVESAELHHVHEAQEEKLEQGLLDFSAPAEEPASAAPSPAASDQEGSVNLDAERDGTLQAPWKWEELLVEAAIIGGADRWQRRLQGLRRELEIHIQALDREEPESSRRFTLERERDQLDHLSRFAMPVVEDLGAFPDEASWGDWLQRLKVLAPVVLRKPERVLAVLSELEPMSDIGPVTLAEVGEVLTDRLSTLERDPPQQRYGRVFVSTPDQARGRSFDVVFLPGLAERIFPQRPREDPLLLDHVRRRLDARLDQQEDRGHQERLRLRLAVGAARDRLYISYPRVDVAEARQRVPSFYALDIARATRGTLPDFEQLEREAAHAGRARLAWPAPPNPEEAIDAVEHDLAVLGPLLQETPPEKAKWQARYLLELNDHLAHSLRSRWVRWRMERWSPEDGLVRVSAELQPIIDQQSLKARPYSVSALQRYAACPYRFLLGSIHRLEPRREAVPLERMDALTRGSLFHEVQARFFRQLKERGELPVDNGNVASALTLLGTTLEQVAEIYRDQLSPAITRVWHDEVDALRADLRAWLYRVVDERLGDAGDGIGGGAWLPEHFELGFGLGAVAVTPGDGCDPGSVKDPVTLDEGWILRGAVDLVESGPQGLRVTDHKTGSSSGIEPYSIVGQGEVLQPVLYSYVVEKLLGRPVKNARLFFCTARGGFKEHLIEFDTQARQLGEKVLSQIERAVARGMLPPAPRKDACKFCDFRVVCGPQEEMRARKKRDPKALAELDTVRSLP